MKTNNMFTKIAKTLSLVAMTLMLANCSKSNNSGGTKTATTPVSSTYASVNGICYQVTNGQYTQQATTTSCSGVNQYYNYYGACYQLVNGQYVQQSSNTPCTVTTSTSTSGYQSMVCTGSYTDGMQVVNCGTQFNCAGYTLMNTQTGQIVRCQ